MLSREEEIRKMRMLSIHSMKMKAYIGKAFLNYVLNNKTGIDSLTWRSLTELGKIIIDIFNENKYSEPSDILVLDFLRIINTQKDESHLAIEAQAIQELRNNISHPKEPFTPEAQAIWAIKEHENYLSTNHIYRPSSDSLADKINISKYILEKEYLSMIIFDPKNKQVLCQDEGVRSIVLTKLLVRVCDDIDFNNYVSGYEKVLPKDSNGNLVSFNGENELQIFMEFSEKINQLIIDYDRKWDEQENLKISNRSKLQKGFFNMNAKKVDHNVTEVHSGIQALGNDGEPTDSFSFYMRSSNN